MASLERQRTRPLSFYEVLQVSPQAGPEVIAAAYRTLARAFHPDVNPAPDAAQRMRELNVAYHVLNDPKRRARYDRQHGGAMRARARANSSAAWVRRPRGAQAAGRASGVSMRLAAAVVVVATLLLVLALTSWAVVLEMDSPLPGGPHAVVPASARP